MSLTFLLLHSVNATVNTFDMKVNFSEPKIYTGGIAISQWNKLTNLEKDKALSKDWFVYYSFRDPKTLKLKRQTHIKAGVNKLKTKKERIAFLNTMKSALIRLLNAGFSPYEDNKELEGKHFGNKEESQNELEATKIVTQVNTKNEISEKTIFEAIDFALLLKEKMMNFASYQSYTSNINLFKNWLKKNGFESKNISTLNKKDVITYLNSVLQNTSPRTRNNYRTSINSLFQVLEDNEIILDNYIKKINVLKSVPTRNKTYSPKLQKEIYSYLEENNQHLLLFIQFISYNFLRPIEVCRLRIEDIDIVDKKLYVKAKNSPVKIKIIPDILIAKIPDLSGKDPKSFLFTRTEIGGYWDIPESYKRNQFTKIFKSVKEKFGLGADYGLYSFRHTFITKLYRKIRLTSSPFEAKSKLMLITGHSSINALNKYLRDIDAELPEDYSNLIE